MLSELGAHVIDADALTHELERQGRPVYAAIVAAFGPDILRADGEIDRAQLASWYSLTQRRCAAGSNSASRRGRRDRQADLGSQISNLGQASLIVVEAVKLIEADLHKQCDALWWSRAGPGCSSTG